MNLFVGCCFVQWFVKSGIQKAQQDIFPLLIGRALFLRIILREPIKREHAAHGQAEEERLNFQRIEFLNDIMRHPVPRRAHGSPVAIGRPFFWRNLFRCFPWLHDLPDDIVEEAHRILRQAEGKEAEAVEQEARLLLVIVGASEREPVVKTIPFLFPLRIWEAAEKVSN